MTASSDALDNRPIPIICGPTASGKTAIADGLADKYPVEIVSADSRQLVRYLDIGTAKPGAQERARVPYHLLDLIEPGERYSAFRFIGDATRCINDILKRGNRPVVVGGTGLYLRALTDGIVEIQESDFEIRGKLEAEMEQLGAEAMYNRLKEIDPLEAIKVHRNNKVRIIRGLEIYFLTGKTKSELAATGTYRKGQFKFMYYCLSPEREWLNERINSRVDEMLKLGLLQELEQLVEQGYREKIRRANIIGYNELLDYLDDRVSLEEATSTIKQNTRRYAKRQMTWFRSQAGCRYFSSAESVLQAVDCE